MTGVIGWSDVPLVWRIVWDATFTFVALIIISVAVNVFGVSSDRYAAIMVPVDLVSLAAALALLWLH